MKPSVSHELPKLMVSTFSPDHSEAVVHIKHRSALLSFCSTTDWLEDTGWVEALVQAKVASADTADSFLKVSRITRTRHAHQVTASSLYILLKRSYAHYQESLEPECHAETFDDCCARYNQDIPQLYFWHTALELELLVFSLVRFLREANFALYVNCLTKLTPWFFTTPTTQDGCQLIFETWSVWAQSTQKLPWSLWMATSLFAKPAECCPSWLWTRHMSKTMPL